MDRWCIYIYYTYIYMYVLENMGPMKSATRKLWVSRLFIVPEASCKTSSVTRKPLPVTTKASVHGWDLAGISPSKWALKWEHHRTKWWTVDNFSENSCTSTVGQIFNSGAFMKIISDIEFLPCLIISTSSMS
jgi:hypothetical protein